jgi:hypothetical protein
MAYQGGIGGTIKGLFAPDLTTRYGAESASRFGAKIFIFMGGLFALGVIFEPIQVASRLAAGDLDDLPVLLMTLLFLLAGGLVWHGRGWKVAALATFFFVMIVLGGGLVMWAIGTPFVAAAIGATRAARACAKGEFDDDVLDIFA